MKRFELVNFLKGYSILTIVIFHYLQHVRLTFPFDKMIWFGGTGVHLFVLLSGFGLYFSYLNRPLSYGVFLKKRVSKIYVPYMVLVLLTAGISLIIPIFENSWYALGGHALFYKMFDERIVGSYGYPLWFMSMIFQFYFTFYGLIWLKSRLKSRDFLLAGVLVSISWAVLVAYTGHEEERVWKGFFLQFFWEFMLGMWLAEQVHQERRVIGATTGQWALFGIGLLNCVAYAALAIKGGDVGKLFNDFFALTGYACLAIWLYRLQISWINRAILFISEISLSVYLLHVLIFLSLKFWLGAENTIYAMLIALALLAPLSMGFQKLVEVLFRWLEQAGAALGAIRSPVRWPFIRRTAGD